ncbi:uncharacterized protein LOC131664315 [Phymastichus coffea]|uniref:uncharacterized protein LOC131664315 n=1 Tax=Phymastichus coffea TaxID=108790 RepID=UPI00273C3E6E|nr:uncharacterized protein LOC131664315 [Phymastichus coffea]
MEKFQQIDWSTNVEDIVDEKFLNEERLRHESPMYKIMNGNFQDPFQHLRRFIHDNQISKSSMKQQPKKFTNKLRLSVTAAGAVKKRGRPKKNDN